jgi:hypothetical protein
MPVDYAPSLLNSTDDGRLCHFWRRRLDTENTNLLVNNTHVRPGYIVCEFVWRRDS